MNIEQCETLATMSRCFSSLFSADRPYNICFQCHKGEAMNGRLTSEKADNQYCWQTLREKRYVFAFFHNYVGATYRARRYNRKVIVYGFSEVRIHTTTSTLFVSCLDLSL